MKKTISVQLTSNLLILINTLMLLVHIMIVLKILPYTFIWGGQIKNDSDLIKMESISILIQILFIFIIALKAGFILKGKFKKTASMGVWMIFAYMLLNTVGNLASRSGMETMIMTPITILLALLLFRLGIEKDEKKDLPFSQ